MTRAGYNFGGWYREIGFSTLWDFGTDTVTGDITLYAKWTAKPGPPDGLSTDEQTFWQDITYFYGIQKAMLEQMIQGVNMEYSFTLSLNPYNWTAADVRSVYTVWDTGADLTGIFLNTTAITIEQGTTQSLYVIFLPWNATNRNVTWTSSDESIVAVKFVLNDGTMVTMPVCVVTAANKAGTATITATTEEEVTFTVTVENPAYTAPASQTVNGVTASVTFSPASPQPAGTGVTATVNFTGTAAEAGTFTLTLTSAKASLSGRKYLPTAQGTVPAAQTFTFTVPGKNVDDFVLSFTHNPPAFTAYIAGRDENGPVYWRNGEKIVLPNNNGEGTARDIAINGNDVYIVGYDGDVPVYWKNGTRYALPYYGSLGGGATAIAISGSDVYIAGWDWTDSMYPGSDVYIVGYDDVPVYWKNGTRYTLPALSGEALAIALTWE